MGPFKPFANKPHTPSGELTLDGTFYVEDGQPWLVYCHEWVQITDGLIKAIRLKPDLSEAVGKPITLLNAAQVPWTAKTVTIGTKVWPGRITDGPEFYRMKNGTLAWPVATGIPLPEGKLKEPFGYRLLDDQGNEALCSVKPTCWWRRTGSVQ